MCGTRTELHEGKKGRKMGKTSVGEGEGEVSWHPPRAWISGEVQRPFNLLLAFYCRDKELSLPLPPLPAAATHVHTHTHKHAYVHATKKYVQRFRFSYLHQYVYMYKNALKFLVILIDFFF